MTMGWGPTWSFRKKCWATKRMLQLETGPGLGLSSLYFKGHFGDSMFTQTSYLKPPNDMIKSWDNWDNPTKLEIRKPSARPCPTHAAGSVDCSNRTLYQNSCGLELHHQRPELVVAADNRGLEHCSENLLLFWHLNVWINIKIIQPTTYYIYIYTYIYRISVIKSWSLLLSEGNSDLSYLNPRCWWWNHDYFLCLHPYSHYCCFNPKFS